MNILSTCVKICNASQKIVTIWHIEYGIVMTDDSTWEINASTKSNALKKLMEAQSYY